MIITRYMIEDAIKLLRTSPDGSNANRQAREKARAVIAQTVKDLESFIAKNPNNITVVALCNTRIGDYNAML